MLRIRSQRPENPVRLDTGTKVDEKPKFLLRCCQIIAHLFVEDLRNRLHRLYFDDYPILYE